MNDAPPNSRSAYFDSIAEKWDGWEDLPRLAARLAAGLADFGVGPDETVVDVGCGTGNLTQALLVRLSSVGRVVAVDIAPGMLEIARRKVRDARASWHVAGAERLPLADGRADRVLCFSVWPHVAERHAVAVELRRVLRPGGVLHIWHLSSREQINGIHAGVGGVIGADLLPPAGETAGLLAGHGFAVQAVVDDAESYLVTAVKEARD
jgi:ubiquinone/menaquinone biosynthesis C-methylase UbiE